MLGLIFDVYNVELFLHKNLALINYISSMTHILHYMKFSIKSFLMYVLLCNKHLNLPNL